MEPRLYSNKRTSEYSKVDSALAGQIYIGLMSYVGYR